ncbi:MAG: DVUA0089 family protein [Pyrinomonadaceae bacterium]|nr:DVUA0089 family protein [Pyrinomonadaceae bacterium]
MITLPPGTYWTMVKSKDNSAGVAVAELSDLSEGTGLEIVSLSGRGLIQSEDNVVMSDFTVEGDTASNLIIRALGPSLNNSGAANMVSDPVLELYDENGSILSTNDNWQENAEQANQIMARGLAPADSAEAAMVVSLSPGNYTAVIRGKNNTTGVASLEVYKLP